MSLVTDYYFIYNTRSERIVIIISHTFCIGNAYLIMYEEMYIGNVY